MKPTEEEIARRNEFCMSERLFNRILRNFIMCTVLSVFVHRFLFKGPSTLLNALAVYGITTFVFYFALLIGQVPFIIFNEVSDFNHHPRAPGFYANRNAFGRILIAILVLAISFFSFYFISFRFFD